MLAKSLSGSTEVFLNTDDLIISKTDLKGRITYANRTFMRIAGFDEEDLLHQPHNMIRHPDMPKGIFKFLWQELRQGHEFFGFVKNYTADHGFYWVFANITPDFDSAGHVQGYFSVRRRPSLDAIKTIESIYQKMIGIERRCSKANACTHSLAFLDQILESKQVSYERFVMQLQAL
ncbi:PAS domain-containing protein [Oceanospirillum sp.]|uniref:PAS domain-containing protein n=1 Tax=Oceanospirillum sp. TaxID=2021254 RepID=UPI003A947944